MGALSSGLDGLDGPDEVHEGVQLHREGGKRNMPLDGTVRAV
jgi:hypothetical protein